MMNWSDLNLFAFYHGYQAQQKAKKAFIPGFRVKILTYIQNQGPGWLVVLQNLETRSHQSLAQVLMFSVARQQIYDSTWPISRREWKSLIEAECLKYAKSVLH